MPYALALAVVVIVYLAVALHRRDETMALLVLRQQEQFESIWDKARAEREILANRIQAPDVAVAQTIDPGENTKQFTAYDDDDDFHLALRELDP